MKTKVAVAPYQDNGGDDINLIVNDAQYKLLDMLAEYDIIKFHIVNDFIDVSDEYEDEDM